MCRNGSAVFGCPTRASWDWDRLPTDRGRSVSRSHSILKLDADQRAVSWSASIRFHHRRRWGFSGLGIQCGISGEPDLSPCHRRLVVRVCGGWLRIRRLVARVQSVGPNGSGTQRCLVGKVYPHRLSRNQQNPGIRWVVMSFRELCSRLAGFVRDTGDGRFHFDSIVALLPRCSGGVDRDCRRNVASYPSERLGDSGGVNTYLRRGRYVRLSRPIRNIGDAVRGDREERCAVVPWLRKPRWSIPEVTDCRRSR